MMFASIVIDIASSNVDIEYEYLVPKDCESYIQIGTRVKVKFGVSNRPVMGYVMDLYEVSRYDGDVKEIDEVLDYYCLINDEQMELAKYLKKDTLSPMCRILNMMIPRFLRLKTVKYFVVKDINNIDANLVTAFNGKSVIKYTKSFEKYQSAINRALKNASIVIRYESEDMVVEKITKKYSLNRKFYYHNLENIRNKERLYFLEYMHNLESPVTKDEIFSNYTISDYLLNKLIKEGFIREEKVITPRIVERQINYEEGFEQILDKTEPNVESYYKKIINNQKSFLWIPNSIAEEQQLILKVTKYNLENDQTTIIICPDILSSYRYSSFLRKFTKMSVACINSNLSDSEFYDYYKSILNDEYPIIVTTSVGAFLPYHNIGTIIMTDIESTNYKNEQSPRYNLNEVIRFRAKNLKTQLLRHSYAPNLLAYSLALRGHDYLLNDNILNNKDLPKTIIVDMVQELLQGNRSPISQVLKNSIETTINKHKKVVLILNNHGYSQSILCRSCGETLKCSNCGISYQYQKDKNRLVCPACGRKINYLGRCLSCESDKLRYTGLGMEQIKEIVDELFPDVNSIMINTSNYDEFDTKMADFLDKEKKYDIVITSDIFSRSIVSYDIGLVGIISLDLVADAPTYEAHHNAYAMLTNAKKHLEDIDDILVIQTYKPKSDFLKYFMINDYDGYFDDELKQRELLKVEPIYQVNRLLIKGEYSEIYKVAYDIKRTLYNLIKYNIIILGPSYNKQEKAVQLIVKHQSKDIDAIYENIYKAFQKTTTIIIFDKYPNNIA